MSLYNSSLTTILYTISMVVCHGSNYLTTSPVVVPNGSSSCDFLTWALWFHSILAMPGSLSPCWSFLTEVVVMSSFGVRMRYYIGVGRSFTCLSLHSSFSGDGYIHKQ